MILLLDAHALLWWLADDPPERRCPGGDRDGADGLVAITDGPDPDSWTAWEVGYAFGTKNRWSSSAPTFAPSAAMPAIQPDADAGRDGPDRPPGGPDHGGHCGDALARIEADRP